MHVPAGVPASDLEPADSDAKGAMMTAEGRFVVMKKRCVHAWRTRGRGGDRKREQDGAC